MGNPVRVHIYMFIDICDNFWFMELFGSYCSILYSLSDLRWSTPEGGEARATDPAPGRGVGTGTTAIGELQ